ncbi:hypothetical protein HN51_067204 [Arachis hypogaea]|nr:uncharacterized protein DS421_14g474260 [Arachis hypogaea]
MDLCARSIFVPWLLLLLMVQLLLFCSGAITPKIHVGITQKIHVTIQNYLEGHQDLTIHCKSKNDDLGAKLVKYMDTYEFNFSLKLFGGTLFFCSFQWPGVCHRVDIYDQDRDQGNCKQCIYKIHENGPFRYAPNNNTYIRFPWKPDGC